jgi:dTDP-glucose pyrophosphorylase
MNHPVRQGVILAAGRGARLQPLSSIRPKPLQPICNKPIMQYHLEAMRDAGIGEVAVVIGPTSAPIRSYFGDGQLLGLRIHYVEDPEPAGIAASLALVEPWLRGPFVVFLGDVFVRLTDLETALSPMRLDAAGTLVVRRDSPEAVRRNFAVIADQEGRIERVIEKPANPPTDLKGCGIYVFDQTIFDAIRRTRRSSLRNEYEITDAIQILLGLGRPVFASEIARWDVNVTYPEDLLACNLRLLHEQRLDNLIGHAVSISERARMASSVVGDRAVLEGPVQLEECLVFPDARVRDIGPVRRRIFVDGVVWGRS